jgi:hypothetical protein
MKFQGGTSCWSRYVLARNAPLVVAAVRDTCAVAGLACVEEDGAAAVDADAGAVSAVATVAQAAARERRDDKDGHDPKDRRRAD